MCVCVWRTVYQSRDIGDRKNVSILQWLSSQKIENAKTHMILRAQLGVCALIDCCLWLQIGERVSCAGVSGWRAHLELHLTDC